MIENEDLDAAVRAGVVPGDVADQLRRFSAKRRAAPAADEERFGLVGGLADIMTALGLFLLLGAATLAAFMTFHLAFASIPLAAWGLAEYFTRRRRLTLSGFVLFGVFVISLMMICVDVAMMFPTLTDADYAFYAKHGIPPLQGMVVAGGATLGSFLWWFRFKLPIACAAGAMAGLNLFTHVLRLVVPAASASFVGVYLLSLGFLFFLIAMWWDLTDIRRETRRADIGFWFHAMAGYQIAGASFRLIFGVVGNPVGWDRLYTFSALPPELGGTIIALVTFTIFCVVSLAIDRRSLLLSSLAFILPAIGRMSGLSGGAAWIVGAIPVGALLVGLSLYWTELRVSVLRSLPKGLRAQLPRTDNAARGQRPVTALF